MGHFRGAKLPKSTDNSQFSVHLQKLECLICHCAKFQGKRSFLVPEFASERDRPKKNRKFGEKIRQKFRESHSMTSFGT